MKAKFIKILNEIYKIKRKKMLDYGYVDLDKKIIVLSSSLSDEQFRHKLLHEVLHVITVRLNMSFADCGNYDELGQWTENPSQAYNHMMLDMLAFALSDIGLL